MSDSIDDFLLAGADERLAMIGRDTGRLRDYLGSEAFEAYVRLAESVLPLRRQHLSVRPSRLIVFVPGVMGSLLASHGLGGVWWIDVPRLRARLEDLRLAQNGEDDIDPTFQLSPVTTDHTYAPFLAALSRQPDFDHTSWAYDWRKPLLSSADRFCELIEAEFERRRTAISIVAHSMGGLAVRCALMRHGVRLWPKIHRIVFLGTPHYGAPVIASYLVEHFWGFNLLALLGRYISRQAFRSMWGVLDLVPAPVGVYPGTRAIDGRREHPCASFGLHTASEYRVTLTPSEQTNLDAGLRASSDMHQQLRDWHFSLPLEHRLKMAVIAGVGKKTVFRLELDADGRLHKLTSRTPNDPNRDGDGRVPIASAALEHIGSTRFVRGEHDALPMIPAVYEDALAWLREKPLALPTTPAGALLAHLAGQPVLPEAPGLLPPARAVVDPESPGYLDEVPPTTEELTALMRALEAGHLPAFERVRIM